MQELNMTAVRGPLAVRGSGSVKPCIRCGTNVAGQQRYRDRHGYWCVPCAKADRATHRTVRLPCDDCGADIRPGSSYIIEDYRLCTGCYQKRVAADTRRQEREVVQAHFRWLRVQDYRRLRQCCVLAALVLTGVIVLCFQHGSKHQADQPSPIRVSSAR